MSSRPPQARPSQIVPRLLSAILLILALLGFELGMVTITFNPVLVADLQQIGQGLPAACLSGGIATYSGISLALGTAPSVDTACLTRLQGDAGAAGAGIQPLVVAALVIVLVALVANLWSWRWSRALGLGLPILAALLLLIEALQFAGVFQALFHLGADAVAGEPSGGLWVVEGLLVAACLPGSALLVVGWARRALAPLEGPGRAGV